MLLSLAEFMDHDEQPLPIDIRTLAEISQKSKAFAKALHFWELQFDTDPIIALDPLIIINMAQQNDAALVLTKQLLTTPHGAFEAGEGQLREEEIYEKLQHWEQAYQSYKKLAQSRVNGNNNQASHV